MTQRTPTTPEEKTAVLALQVVRMMPASWEKRFRSQLNPEQLSEKERPQVWRLFKKYRRQIHGREVNGQTLLGAPWQNLLDMADRLSAPDYRKMNAAQIEQSRIDQLRHQNQTKPNEHQRIQTKVEAPDIPRPSSPSEGQGVLFQT